MAESTFDEQWLQSSEAHSAPLEDISEVTVVDPSTPGDKTVLMSLPGVEFDKDPTQHPSTAVPVKFVQFHLSTLISLYQELNQTVLATLGDVSDVKDAAIAATQEAHDEGEAARRKGDTAAEQGEAAAGKAQLADEKAQYAGTQGDRAKAWADHPPYIGNGTTGDKNYWYLWDETAAQYARGAYAKGDDLDYNTMTEEEVQRLMDNIKADLVFADTATCEAIIGELT